MHAQHTLTAWKAAKDTHFETQIIGNGSEMIGGAVQTR